MKKFYLIFILIFFHVTALAAKENSTLTINTLDGKKFVLEDKIGKVVIVNFWAKWCINCRQEMPILDEIYKKYQSRGLEIIGISVDAKSQRQKVLEIASEFSYPNSMFYDAIETIFEEPKQLPTNYLIDETGKIVAKIDDLKDFENILKPWL